MPLSTKLAAAIKLNVFVCIVNRLDGWGRIYSRVFAPVRFCTGQVERPRKL
jgi:hypothetical protein